MVASLCLQWNYTQHLVDYSNICQISMLFISFFCQKMSCVWNLRHCVPSVFLLKSVLIALKILPQMSKHYISGPQEWLARPRLFIINTSGSQWKQRRLMLTKHSPFIPAEMWQLEFVQKVWRARHTQRFWASCLLNTESGGWWLFGQALYSSEDGTQMATFRCHKFQGSLQPCQIQIFLFVLLVIKWLTIFLIGNTNCHSLHFLGLFFLNWALAWPTLC